LQRWFFRSTRHTLASRIKKAGRVSPPAFFIRRVSAAALLLLAQLGFTLRTVLALPVLRALRGLAVVERLALAVLVAFFVAWHVAPPLLHAHGAMPGRRHCPLSVVQERALRAAG
jgi:hypothetical protein